MTQLSATLQAALWMSGAMVSFSLMAIGGRSLSDDLDTFEIMLYRSLLGILIVVSVGYMTGTLHQIKTRRRGLHLFRNIAHFTGQNLWFYALAAIPLSQLFAFEFTTPLWVAALAPLVLKERWTFTRLLACLLGFAGILIVARPDIITFEPATFAAIFCAIGFAGAVLSTKLLSRTDSVTCILFWLVIIQAILGLMCAGYDGHITPLNADTLPWAVIVGVCGLVAHFCLTTALSIAPATVVTPLEFLRLPLITVIGYLLYDEPLLLSVFAGAAIILIANIMNIRAETTRQATDTD